MGDSHLGVWDGSAEEGWWETVAWDGSAEEGWWETVTWDGSVDARQLPGMWKTVSRDGSAEMSPGMRRNISAEEETVTRDSLTEEGELFQLRRNGGTDLARLRKDDRRERCQLRDDGTSAEEGDS